MEPTDEDVAKAFVEAIENRDIEGVERVFVFGSAAREEATPASDIDLFCVLNDRVDRRKTTEQLRAIAFDLLMEYDTVIDVHTMKEMRFQDRRDHPFTRQVIDDGVAYA